MTPARPLAVFRADAGPAIGGGHVMRCLALADRLTDAGWRCAFASRRGTVETVAALERSGLSVQCVEGGPSEESAALRTRFPNGCALLVVDSYALDDRFETACRSWAGSILAIDDLNDRRHDCDVLLNQNLGWTADDYAALAPAASRLLIGPRYALLRPQFAASRPAALAARRDGITLRRILIAMGNFDPDNATETVLRGIDESGLAVEADVVLGGSAPHLTAVRARIAAMKMTARLHLSVDDMAGLMTAADLSIGAAGTTSWERCALGLPALLVVLADNQRRIADALVEAGAADSLGWHERLSPEAVAGALRSLAGAPARLGRMSGCAAAVCDAGGAARVAAAATDMTISPRCLTTRA
jgi:UDP-2,4-diacetamido-2,4,6-trideoxy-beta-L-altropyranose hydrolase